ncbi:MAG: hypothetical protein ACO3CC_15690, partial [Alphaproteobacteria bacterium]
MAREDGFLSRWSRLKKEASRQAPPPPTEAEQAAARAAEDGLDRGRERTRGPRQHGSAQAR